MLNIQTGFKPATLCLAIMQIALLSPVHAVAGEQDFTLVNKTGIAITSLHISPHSSDEWGEDILGKDTLSDGDSLDIKFHRTETAAHWDLKISDKDGTTFTWESLNLKEISEVTLYLKDGTATATFK